jgi:hypothetical protein
MLNVERGVKRVIVLGRGGAGKSTFATRLSVITGLPVTELDNQFWQPGLEPARKRRWAAIQTELITPERWILDGDLAHYDVLDVRLKAADTVIILDFPFWRCALCCTTIPRERGVLAVGLALSPPQSPLDHRRDRHSRQRCRPPRAPKPAQSAAIPHESHE